MSLVILSLVVFALSLILTKSKLLACKRKYIEDQYIASKVNNKEPNIIHRWWHALWHCPMCSGFWISVVLCYFHPVHYYFIDVCVVFGLNWLLHCLEDLMFGISKCIEKIEKFLEKDLDNFDF